ncbi:hypothetical protein RRG08_017846 [Elysia crispata]|uniref:Uncharacterized protein n=1 Tax=Elysia crispata TaxID=231223 RepID=A0AAE1CK52_9GAST|nr:hypothetical protein RRG08_017846 [Elysia crispata]
MTIERLTSKKFCEQCLLSGFKSPIQLFQLNDEEALLMCKNESCTFMPAENWKTLIVKRHISQISRSSIRKNRPLSLISESSFSGSKVSVHSAPQRLPVSLNKHTKSSTPCLIVKPHSIQAASNLDKSFIQQLTQRPLSSPTPSIDTSTSEEPERRTLVPIAPFLCRHAHSFASFERKNSDDQANQEFLLNKRENHTLWNLNRLPARGLKRRGSSLDSDSLSSCSSSVDSRPTSPTENTVKSICWQNHLKPKKKVFLSALAVSKLREGSCKLRLIKDSKGQTSHVKLVPLTSHRPDDSSLISIISNDKDLKESSQSEGPFTLGGLELNSVKNIHQCLPSSEVSNFAQRHIIDTKKSSTFSIQAHIDAINQHLSSLREAVDGTDFTLPDELSLLLPYASNNFVVPTNLMQRSSEKLEEGTPSCVSNVSGLSLDESGEEQQKNSGAESLLFDESSLNCMGLDAYFVDNFTL